MARERNTIATRQITVSTTDAVCDYLVDLTKTGLWGKNPAEAAERLVAEGIRQLIEKSVLAERPRKK